VRNVAVKRAKELAGKKPKKIEEVLLSIHSSRCDDECFSALHSLRDFVFIFDGT
jgi:hypothetical protein